VNRCDTAHCAELRRSLLSGDVFQDFLNDVRTGDIGDHTQPTAAVRTDRQINREHSSVQSVQRENSVQMEHIDIVRAESLQTEVETFAELRRAHKSCCARR